MTAIAGYGSGVFRYVDCLAFDTAVRDVGSASTS